MFKAPKYKKSDIDTSHKVHLKFYVPFNSDQEKNEFIRQNHDEDEDSNDSPTIEETPDGKYESKIFEFVYHPFRKQHTISHAYSVVRLFCILITSMNSYELI